MTAALESVTYGKTTYERWPAREVSSAQGVRFGNYEATGYSEAYVDKEYAGRSFEKWFGITHERFMAEVSWSRFRDVERRRGEQMLAANRAYFFRDVEATDG